MLQKVRTATIIPATSSARIRRSRAASREMAARSRVCIGHSEGSFQPDLFEEAGDAGASSGGGSLTLNSRSIDVHSNLRAPLPQSPVCIGIRRPSHQRISFIPRMVRQYTLSEPFSTPSARSPSFLSSRLSLIRILCYPGR